MAGEPAKKKPYELKFSVLKLTPSFPPPLPVGTSDSGLSGIPADLLHSHSSGSSEEWHTVGASGEPGFQNGWVPFDTGRTPKFKKIHGTVYMVGLAKSGTLNTVIFNLPIGYRQIAVTNLYIGTSSSAAFATLRIDSNGDVKQEAGNNTWISLACSFRAD
jgi:hypothetical protein